MRFCHRNSVKFVSLLFCLVFYVIYNSASIRHDEESRNTIDYTTWMQNQRQRRRHLANRCKSESNLTLEHLLTRPLRNGYDLLDLTIVDDTHKLIYCYVPKVATTNWKKVFLLLTGKAKSLNEIDRYNPHDMAQFRKLRQYTLKERKERISNYTKFLFVRHPHQRLISAYYDRLRYDPSERDDNFQKIIGTEIIRRYRPPNETSEDSLNLGHDVKFTEFVQFLTDHANPDRLTNIHFRPITELCYPCQMNYTFIGKYENLIEDVDMILQQVNVSLPFAFPSNNKHSRTSQRLVRDFRSITDDQRNALFREYRNDFHLFNYDPDEWLDI